MRTEIHEKMAEQDGEGRARIGEALLRSLDRVSEALVETIMSPEFSESVSQLSRAGASGDERSRSVRSAAVAVVRAALEIGLTPLAREIDRSIVLCCRMERAAALLDAALEVRSTSPAASALLGKASKKAIEAVDREEGSA